MNPVVEVSQPQQRAESVRPVSFHSTAASVYLDALRALAAIIVLLSHWRNFLFVDYPQLTAHRALLLVPYLVSGAGHQAVIIFFVLSGYLIGKSVIRNMDQQRWDWKDYLLHRLTRLWIVLIPALVLGGLLDTIGIHSGLAPLLYAGKVPNHMLGNVAANLTVRAFLTNLLFLQGRLGGGFGSNGPLWSLTNEFWYYILFPCALLSLNRSSIWGKRIAYGTLFCAIAVLIRWPVFVLFPIWLAGAALARWKTPVVPRRFRVLILVLYVPVFFGIAKSHLSQIPADYLLALATVPLMWTLLSYRLPAAPSLWTRLSRRSAAFSYTLYVVHVPLVVLFTAALAHDHRWIPTLPHFGWALLVLIAVLAYAYLVASLTEFHTEKVRKAIQSRLPFLRVPGRSA